jgi:hypothetical protein
VSILDKATGRAKKAAGDLKDDAKLRREGRKEERKGERLGFRRVGEFTTPDGKRTVTTMWREVERPRAAATSG